MKRKQEESADSTPKKPKTSDKDEADDDKQPCIYGPYDVPL